MTMAPIVLFTYARPEHTQRTLEALAANALADKSDLIVYADAARSAQEVEAVCAVRDLVRSGSGFRSVRLIERATNFGLARNIIEGVSEVLRQYERVIVLEDDMVTSPYFLAYMNEALERYSSNERVMHISGYIYPMHTAGLPETFFLPPASCWGWATWRRAWQHFRKAPDELLRSFTVAERRTFNLDQSFPYWSQVELNARGAMNTWAIFWYASVFQRKGLCLHPRQSYVQNIGNDDSGTHTRESTVFDVVLNPVRIEQWCESGTIDELALARLKAYFRASTSWYVKLRMAVESILARIRAQVPAGDGQ
jgi:GT2 family glycosyltransferase